jgi:hypothetical protein
VYSTIKGYNIESACVFGTFFVFNLERMCVCCMFPPNS